MKIGKLGVSRFCFGRLPVNMISLIPMSIRVCRLCFLILTAAQRISHDPRTLRDHGATLDAPAENIRPKHDRYFSHGRARPNALAKYMRPRRSRCHELSLYLNRVCTGQSSYSERASAERQSASVTPQVNLSFPFVSRVSKHLIYIYCYRELIVSIVVSAIAVFRLIVKNLSSSLHC